MFIIDYIKRSFFPFYKLEKTKKVLKILNQGEKNKRQAMFVGGCVRKHLTMKEVDDIDIATIFTPEQIIKKFENTNVQVKKTGFEHGTLTLILDGQTFEITTLREDVSTDGRHANVSFTDDWKKDSERRDFTINAIYLDQRGKIFDPQSGFEDLKNKKIKFIGDPNQRIKEDYLRILRFIRFSIQYKNFNLSSDIQKAIEINLSGITKLSRERIYSELEKIIKLENFEDIFKSEFLLNIFKLIFPEFKYIDRVKNFQKIRKIGKLLLEQDIILSSILIDQTNNWQYFSHKYNISNDLKNNLSFYSETLKEIYQNKDFFKKDLKKNIFYHGKKKIKSLFLIFILVEGKISKSKLNNLFLEIDKILIPILPINGKNLLEKGVKEGKMVGEILKKAEKKWIDNNFKLNDEELNNILKKYLV